MKFRMSLAKTVVFLLIGLLSIASLQSVVAQDPPQPPKPKQGQADENEKAKDRKGAMRQGAQAEGQSNDPDSTIKLDTDLVNLDVTVVDQNNQPVFDMKKEDFSVFEDKVKQNIDSVSREEIPLSFGIVVDTSGSMRAKLQTVTDAADDLIKQMKEADEAFISQFKAEPELVQDFTSDKRELEEALGELFTSGGTALLDAIIATADYAQEKANTRDVQRRRRALIVITDGLEKNSTVKEKEVLEALKEDEVQVYLVGFVDEDEEGKSLFGRSTSKKAKDLLSRLAEDSGGRAFFPKELSEMKAIANQIAKDLRTQYIISYYPTNEKRDGTFRTVKVMVDQKGNRKLIARARNGYYARDSKGQIPSAAAGK
ncbi:MAG: VWA domain-containing protein, partial [Blastocatellia bacterium]|nr:VWA domain-containing protein [Blastocatellia bacterium]